MKTIFTVIGIGTTLFFGLPYALAIVSLFSQVNNAFNF